MAKGVYACVNGVSRNVKQIPLCVNGVSRNTKEGYACVDGVSRQFFSSGYTLSDLAVGDSVFMDFSGLGSYNNNEFMIVHKGLPSTAYDSSCDGIWVMAKYMEQLPTRWSTTSSSVSYGGSSIHQYLNNEVLSKFDSTMQNIIKEVTIPSRLCTVSTKLFLLSYDEVVGKQPYDDNLIEGAILDYFNGASAEDRKCLPSSSDTGKYGKYWWLRTQYPLGTSDAYCIDSAGNYTWAKKTGGTTLSNNIQPRFAMILPHDTRLDENFNIIA